MKLIKRSESPAKVAYFLGCGRTSVYTWLKAGREASERLAAKPHPGSETSRSRNWKGYCSRGAKAHGWHSGLWNAHRVAEVVHRRFDITYHVEHVRKIIRRQLNWSSRKPQKRAKQRNEEKVVH